MCQVKRQIAGCTMALLLFGVVGLSWAATAPVAKVGQVVVTEEDLQQEIQKRLPMVSFHGGVKPEKLEKIRQEAKDALVVRAYKLQYALEREMKVDPKIVDADWATLVAKQPELAKATGPQVEQLKNTRYNDLLAKMAEDEAVTSKVTVSDEEAKQYYEQNKKQYFQGRLYKASHILVKVDPSSNAEEKEAKRLKAEKLLARAKAGEDFFNLAYYESDDRSKFVGGSIGSFHAGQTVPEFDAEIQKMKPGEISGPVRTMHGFHIVKLDDVQEARQLTFEQSEEKVRSRLADQKRTKIYEAWMSELRQKYPLQMP